MNNNIQKDKFDEGSQEHSGVLAFYRSLPDVGGACACIFDRGDYYSVHGPTARLAATSIFHTNAVIKKRGYGDNQVDTVFLNRSNFESFLRELLLVRQYRVNIYRQATSNRNDWQEEYKASPGNLGQLEDVLFGGAQEQSCLAGIIAIKVATDGQHKVVGVGYVEVTGRLMQVAQFTDTDAFTNLEALLVQLAPKECLLPNGEGKSKLAMIVQRSGVLVTERKKSEFTSSSDTAQDLCRLVRGWSDANVAGKPVMEDTHAIAALNAAIKYLELTSNEGHFNQFSCARYDLSQYMRLDSAALSALHVERDPTAPQQQTNGSLLAVLDKCRTGAGHRMMAQWLRQPLVDINKIGERHDLVSAFVESIELRNSVSDGHLKRVPDLPRIARRLIKGQATLLDCHKLYQCALLLPDLCGAVATYDGDHHGKMTVAFTGPLQDSVGDFSKFVEMVETTVDLDQARNGQYVIKPDFDEELSELREKLDGLITELHHELRVAATDLGLEAAKTIKLENNSQYGYFFRVTLKDEKCLRNNCAYMTLDTNKAGVRFRNSRVVELNTTHSKFLKEYEKIQAGVVKELLIIAAGYVEVIHQLSTVLSTLDCVCSLASAAVSSPVPYVRPSVIPAGGDLAVTQCRHPCLELLDTVSFIPNDCNMGLAGGKLHLLTGPNMGGKSTYLRSVATVVLLAHCGSFVPADHAQIPIMDAILARVGAGDCQMKGVSTFMAEMLETATIIKIATPNSLIIVDELGRGTSTYDGFGLAWAIADHIARELGSFCVFATHFHELTALADTVPSVRNLHVAATTADGSLTLLYQVLAGPCDRSFGIHCAKIAHFPAKVIEDAERKAAELEDDFGDGDDTEEAVNKRRKDKKSGEELITSCLKQAFALDVDELSDEQLEEELDKLRVQVKAKNNPYINSLLTVV